MQAVTELGSAMMAGERSRLEDAIRQGTAALYRAGTAPDTASASAAVSCIAMPHSIASQAFADCKALPAQKV